MPGTPRDDETASAGPGGAVHRRVLVLGTDERAFLSVVRSLGRRGIEVHTGWCAPGAPALRSRYIARNHEIRPYSPESRLWEDDLLAAVRSAPFDLVIPCTDETEIPLRRAREELGRHARLCLLSDRAHGIVSDKSKTSELARSLGVPVPDESPVGSIEEAAEAARTHGFPLVLKPISSFDPFDPSSKNRVRIAFDRGELERLAESMLLRGRVLAQRYCPGRGTGIEILARSGTILFAFRHERIHEPLRGGGSSYRRSVPLDGGMLDAARRIAAALDYTGVAMFEFRHDRTSGEWRLLEINGRFWGSLPLALAAGADFPWYLYQMLVEGRREFGQGYRTGICCRNLASDIHWNIVNLSRDRSDPRMNTLPLGSVLAEARHLLLLRERSDTFVIDDPLPGFAQIASLAGSVMKKLRGRIGRAAAPGAGGRPAGLREILARSRKIHFVCKGNICRSPYAERYARSVLPPDIEVGSSGYLAPAGRRPPPEAVEAARESGIDLSAHRSSLIDAGTVGDREIVFVFDDSNRREIERRFPEARSRTFMIGLLADPPVREVPDPYGGDLGEFRRTYALIRRAVDGMALHTRRE
ncbi:MAG: ATP-grasp domain-containing protein [Candidatus Krumholzibacteria bacterium]|nr:ATP-grasp domain-containing protein [Candidatus Krumholzibacteria bacterium]